MIFLLKQVCLQVQSFKTGMSNQQRENVLTYENFKELPGFRKYGASRWSFITLLCLIVGGEEATKMYQAENYQDS